MRDYDAWKTRTPEDEQSPAEAPTCNECGGPLEGEDCPRCDYYEDDELPHIVEDLARGESDYEDAP